MFRSPVLPMLGVAVFACLALGCGGSSHHTAAGVGGGAAGVPQANGSAGAQGAPAGNGNNGGGGAPGAPVKIPDIIQLQGAPVEGAINSLKDGIPLGTETRSYNGIIAQCGGTLCVKLSSKPDPDLKKRHNFSSCVSTGETDPPRGSLAARGSTIYVLTGDQPCQSSEPAGSGSPSGSGGSGQPSVSPGVSPAPDDSFSP